MWPGYVAKASTQRGEGALGPGPASHPGRVGAGRQLPAAFSAAAAETNDSTEEEYEKINMNVEGGELGTGAGIFPRGAVSARWLGDHGGLECGWTEGEVGWGVAKGKEQGH